MPYRKPPFATNEIYHTISRGVAKKPIFTSERDYQRALRLIDFYRYNHPPLRFSHFNRLAKKEKGDFLNSLKRNNPPIVDILAFCLMPNHIHFLLKQLKERGVPIFISNFQNSYARYFNTKYKRIGPLFQPMFKAIRIETEEQLLHVSRYIHLNPPTSYLLEIKDLKNYPWSSFTEYLGIKPFQFTNPNLILGHFKTREAYRKFVFDQANYQRELATIKHLILEG